MTIHRIAALGATVLLALGGCRGVAAVPEPIRPATAVTPHDAFVDSANAGAMRLDRYLTGLEALGFSGAIIVDHGGEVVLRRGYGLADREARRRYTPSTVQSMGSITKQVTAAAILLLEGRGLLSASDSLGRHLQEVPADKRGITLHHLLTHQAGFPESIGRDAEPLDAAAYLVRAMQSPLQFAPGEGFDYSNVGYSLLGIIVERVSGRTYEQFVREELLLPAGLLATGYLLPGHPESALARGYRDAQLYGTGGEMRWMEDGPGWNLRANGGLRTTVGDMHRWLAVLRGEGPLSAAQVARWTETHVAASTEFGYAYGWATWESPVGRVIMHSGGNPAFASIFSWLPEHELFVYAHGNSSLWEAPAHQESLLRAWFDSTMQLPPAVATDWSASPQLASQRAGEYVSGSSSVTLAADDVRLRAELDGQAVMDALLAHDAVQRDRLERLNRSAAVVIERLAASRDDALEGLVRAGTDPAARARSLSQLLARQGSSRTLTAVGSVANVPGSHFGDDGGWTTFVRVSPAGGRPRILSLLWHDDGTYRSAALGPLSDVPGFVLVPEASGALLAVERTAPWRTHAVRFEGDCLVIEELAACRRGKGG
jgi:CubicO group peptidase (beta-lactamase class C family)